MRCFQLPCIGKSYSSVGCSNWLVSHVFAVNRIETAKIFWSQDYLLPVPLLISNASFSIASTHFFEMQHFVDRLNIFIDHWRTYFIYQYVVYNREKVLYIQHGCEIPKGGSDPTQTQKRPFENCQTFLGYYIF